MNDHEDQPLVLRLVAEIGPRPRTPDTRSPFEYGPTLDYDRVVQCERCSHPLNGSRRFCAQHRAQHGQALAHQMREVITYERARRERLRSYGWLTDQETHP